MQRSKFSRPGYLALILVTLLAIGCSSSRLTTENQQARQFYEEALTHLTESRTDLAQDALQKSLHQDPGFLEAIIELASIYDSRNLHYKSVKLYERAYQLAPARTDILTRYSEALLNDRQHDEALVRAQELALKEQKSAKAQFLLARAQDQNGLYEAAEASYKLAIQLDPQYIEAHRALGRYYYDRLSYSKALRPFASADDLNGLVTYDDLFEYAYCLLRERKPEEAAGFFAKALEILPEDQQAEHYREQALAIAKGTLKFQAWQIYEETFETQVDNPTLVLMLLEALDIQPDYLDARARLASLYREEGLLEDALKEYDKILALDPDDHSTMNDKGLTLFELGDYDSAIAAFEKSLAVKSEGNNAEKNLEIVVRLKEGNLKEQAYRYYKESLEQSKSDSAIHYLEKAIQTDSTYYEAYLRLGIMKMNRQFYVDATNAFIQGLKFAPDDETRAIFYFDLGLVHFYRDFHVKAIESFENAIKYNPEDYDAYYYLSKTYIDYGDTKKATQYHQDLLKLKPDYFAPTRDDYSEAGLTDPPAKKAGSVYKLWPKHQPAQVLKYKMTIHSENNALLGADVDGSFVRDIEVTFEMTIEEVDEIGNIEVDVRILSIKGYGLTPAEKQLEGSTVAFRLSDVFGIITVYSLMEDRPSDLMQAVTNTVEEMYTFSLKKPVAVGESWTTKQYVVGLGGVDAVSFLDRVDDNKARIVSRYGVTGSYDAARYGGTGYVVVQNKGQAELSMDLGSGTVAQYSNLYETSTYTQSTAEWSVQEANYSVTLVENRQEQYVARKKVLIEGVPYVKQHGPQCAAASLSMVLHYYQNEIDQDSIYSAIKSDYAGAQSYDILRFPRENGYKSYGYISNLDDLKEKIDLKIPVILYFSPYGFGHVVVAIGYDEKKRRIIIHDPTIAGDYEIPYTEFLAEWKESDFECTVVLPEDRNISTSNGPITSHEAVETKWSADKKFSDHKYDEALELYQKAAELYPNYVGALEGIVMVNLARDKYDDAEKALEKVISIDPNSVQVILRNAQLLMSRYDYDKVIELAKKSQALDESNIMNYIYLAQALQSQKKYDEALEEIKKAINLNPLTSFPRNMLTSILVDMGEFEQAYEQARLALKFEPENIGNHFQLSSVYTSEIDQLFLHGRKRRENFKKALEATNFVKKVNPDLPNLDVIYADLYMNDYQYDRAEKLYRNNIEKYPDENIAYNNLAWHFAERNINLEEAEKLSRKSIELSENNPYYYDTIGWIHFKMGLYEKAAQEFIETINYDKYSEFAYRHLGIVYARMGKVAQAEEQFDLVMKLVPDKRLAALELADECERNGLDDYAIKFYKKALETEPNCHFAAFRLAYLYVRNEMDPNEAYGYAEKAYSADDSSFFYNGVLGMVYLKKGEIGKAQNFLKRAVQLQAGYNDPGREMNHYYLGLAHLEQGETELARAQFKKYLELAPQGILVSEVEARIENLSLKD